MSDDRIPLPTRDELDRLMTPATAKPHAGGHAKGPWRVGKPQGGRGLVWADGVAVADCLNGDGSDDARRIVACVNACEGIATESLEVYGAHDLPDFELIDALRDTLEMLAVAMEQIAKTMPEAVEYMPDLKWMPEKARALLANGR